jgi:hypothetical protein
MSTILEQFGPATVLLFRTKFESDLPTKARLREVLMTKEVRYYSANGLHCQDLSRLSLATHLSAIAATDHHTEFEDCSHAVIAHLELRCNSFAVLSFAPMLVAGYNVNESCLATMESLLALYKEVRRCRAQAEHWVRGAHGTIDLFTKLGIKDDTVENIDRLRLRELEETYAIGTLQTIHDGLGKWAKDFSWTANQSGEDSVLA